MDQRAEYTKADVLDLSVLLFDNQSRGGKFDSINAWLNNNYERKQRKPGATMSEEELRIRGELESEIERNLEEEIKDGIYHLSFRLHRLYQHKRERHAGERKDRTLSEVNISIRIEGGTKIEIKEAKNEDFEKSHQPQPGRSRSDNNLQCRFFTDRKKFDWARSLRSRAGPPEVFINRKNEFRANQAKIVSNDLINNPDNRRRNLSSSASGRHKSNMGVNNNSKNRVLELGWKC